MGAPDLTLAAPGGWRHLRLLGLRIDLRAVATVLGVFLSTRLVLLLVVFLSSAALPMPSGPFGYAIPDNIMLDGLIRHDSWWYVSIVERGYSAGDLKTGEQGTVTFFPLYPLLVKAAAAVTGDVFLAGLLVSNAAFLAALGFLYALAQLEYGDEAAARAIFYMAAAPSTVFFTAMYTESLFVALVCATFYFARRGRWELAAAAGALGAATRNTGLLLAAVVLLEALAQRGVRLRPERPLGASAGETARLWGAHLATQARLALAAWPSAIFAGYVLVGLVAYMAFLQVTFGDALAFVHAQATWGRSTGAGSITKIVANITTNLNLGPQPWIGQVNTLTILNVLSTVGFLPLVVMVALRMRPAYAVYAALTFYAPLSTGSVGSMTRYVLMLTPCFMLLAAWGRRPWVDRLVLAVFLPLTTYFAVLFSHWYFVG